MTQFENFMEAESAAISGARAHVLGISSGVGTEIIRDRKVGLDWTEEEKRMANILVHVSLADAFRNILTGFIVSGMVRECRLSRKFMAPSNN